MPRLSIAEARKLGLLRDDEAPGSSQKSSRKNRRKRERSALETGFAQQVKIANLPVPTEEYKFSEDRKFRFDFAWPDLKIAMEIEGGIWTRGRHTRGSGYENDVEKYNLACLLGWQVYRATANTIQSGQALTTIHMAIARAMAATTLLKKGTEQGT